MSGGAGPIPWATFVKTNTEAWKANVAHGETPAYMFNYVDGDDWSVDPVPESADGDLTKSFVGEAIPVPSDSILNLFKPGMIASLQKAGLVHEGVVLDATHNLKKGAAPINAFEDIFTEIDVVGGFNLDSFNIVWRKTGGPILIRPRESHLAKSVIIKAIRWYVENVGAHGIFMSDGQPTSGSAYYIKADKAVHDLLAAAVAADKRSEAAIKEEHERIQKRVDEYEANIAGAKKMITSYKETKKRCDAAEAKRKLIREGKGDKAAEIAAVEAEIAKRKARKFPAAANAQTLSERLAPAKTAKKAADEAAGEAKKACKKEKKKGCKNAYTSALKENKAVFAAAEKKATDDNLKARNSAVQKEMNQKALATAEAALVSLKGSAPSLEEMSAADALKHKQCLRETPMDTVTTKVMAADAGIVEMQKRIKHAEGEIKELGAEKATYVARGKSPLLDPTAAGSDEGTVDARVAIMRALILGKGAPAAAALPAKCAHLKALFANKFGALVGNAADGRLAGAAFDAWQIQDTLSLWSLVSACADAPMLSQGWLALNELPAAGRSAVFGPDPKFAEAFVQAAVGGAVTCADAGGEDDSLKCTKKA